MIYVLIYLLAVVAANLSVAAFGPPSVYVNAFLFIGLTLTVRDRLHEFWTGRHLFRNMAAVIVGGAVLSWAINRDAGPIAVASVAAFLIAESVDALVFHALRHRTWMVRANGSNIPSALADSVVFPALAFGAFLPMVTVGQFAAKVLGGFVWAIAIQAWARARINAATAKREIQTS